MKPKCDFTTGRVVDDKGLEPWGRHQLCLRLFETHRSLHPNVGHSLWRFAAKWRLPPGVGWWQCQDHVSQRWFDNSGRICHIVRRHSTRKWRHKLRVDGSAWLWWNRRHVSMNFVGLSETLWCAWLCPTLRREGIYWFHLVRPSVLPSAHLSVSGQNRVRSVFSTILARSISYLHILSTKFRRCVACRVFSYKIPKFIFCQMFLVHAVPYGTLDLCPTRDRCLGFSRWRFLTYRGYHRLQCIQPDLANYVLKRNLRMYLKRVISNKM